MVSVTNVVPSDFDIYDPTWRMDAVMQRQIRDAFSRLLSQGWVDAVRQLHPYDRMYTYWTTEKAFQRNKGMRLDFLLVNPQLQPLLTDAGVDAVYRGGDKPSDHAPTWINIRSSRSRVA